MNLATLGRRDVSPLSYSARDVDAVRLGFAGLVAGTLMVAPKTVRNNVSAILTKLCVRDRAEAIAAAHAANLGTPPSPRT